MQQRSDYGQKTREWVARWQAEIDKRKEEERLNNGSQVWFSRCIHQGRRRHWVLIIEGTKYELTEGKHSGEIIFRIKTRSN